MRYSLSAVNVICGPMKSGKSKEIFSILDRLQHKQIPYLIFKPHSDTRTATTVATRFLKQHAESIIIDSQNPHDILKHVDTSAPLTKPFAILIDEAQFFAFSIVDIVKYLASLGYTFFIAGLETDAKQRTFGPMGNLLAFADVVKKLQSVCENCHGSAFKTTLSVQRDNFAENGVVIETDDFYKSMCNECNYSLNREHVHKTLDFEPISKILKTK